MRICAVLLVSNKDTLREKESVSDTMQSTQQLKRSTVLQTAFGLVRCSKEK